MYFYSKRISVQGVMSSEYLLSVSGSGGGEDKSSVLSECGDKPERDPYNKPRCQHVAFVVALANGKNFLIFLGSNFSLSLSLKTHVQLPSFIKVSMPFPKLLLSGA